MSQDLPENTTGTVVWDYHVIAVERDAHSSVIYDLTRYHITSPASLPFGACDASCLVICNDCQAGFPNFSAYPVPEKKLLEEHYLHSR